MTKERFFQKTMEEEYPDAGFLRIWWERKKLDLWWKLPTGRGEETNGQFVEKIIDHNI